MRKYIDAIQRLDELSRPNEMEDAEPILLRAGWEIAGQGYYGSVYCKEGADYVLKLFDSRDRAYLAFLKLIKEHPNPHFPKILGKLVKITPYYWAVRMEMLNAIPKDAPNLGVYLISLRHEVSREKNEYQYEAYLKVIAYLEGQPRLKEALDLINEHLLDRYRQDLHMENFMARPDGTLVIIDPVN